MIGNQLNVVIVDDNTAIIEAIKAGLYLLNRKNILPQEKIINFYSAKNGVDGLGLVFVIRPEIIIIDTTLPKYSGREVLSFLVNNKLINESGVKIIIIFEHEISKIVPYDYPVLWKSDQKFVEKLGEIVFSNKLELNDRVKLNLVTSLHRWANRGDVYYYDHIMKKSQTGLLAVVNKISLIGMFIPWIIIKIIVAIQLLNLKISRKYNNSESTITIIDTSATKLRSIHMPSLALFLSLILLMIFQLGIIILGGYIFFNML